MEFTCQHCGNTHESIGTRGGCFSCRRVMSTDSGKVDREAMKRRMMTPRERVAIARIQEG